MTRLKDVEPELFHCFTHYQTAGFLSGYYRALRDVDSVGTSNVVLAMAKCSNGLSLVEHLALLNKEEILEYYETTVIDKDDPSATPDEFQTLDELYQGILNHGDIDISPEGKEDINFILFGTVSVM